MTYFVADLKDKEIYTIRFNQLAPCSRPIIIDPSENEKITPFKNSEGFSLDIKLGVSGHNQNFIIYSVNHVIRLIKNTMICLNKTPP